MDMMEILTPKTDNELIEILKVFKTLFNDIDENTSHRLWPYATDFLQICEEYPEKFYVYMSDPKPSFFNRQHYEREKDKINPFIDIFEILRNDFDFITYDNKNIVKWLDFVVFEFKYKSQIYWLFGESFFLEDFIKVLEHI